MTLTDDKELSSSAVMSDLTFFDLESNHSDDSIHLLCEKYTHKLPIKSKTQITFRLTPTEQNFYKQSTLHASLTLKQRLVLFTRQMKGAWAKVQSCRPNKYFKMAFILAILIPLAVWIFYIDFHLR